MIRAGQPTFPDRQRNLQRQLAEVEKRLRHLVNAIVTEKATEAVYSELQKAETMKKTLQGELQGLEHVEWLHAPSIPVCSRETFRRG